MNSPFEVPANSSRLFDLITVYDEQFKPAFYFAFQDTLVTSSLDIVFLSLSSSSNSQASKLAYSKKEVLYRVVTLSGQIIEKSGTMSGGGRYQRHGMMRLKNSSSNKRQSFGEEITEEVVNELENAVKVLSNQFNQLQQQTNEHKVRFLIVFS